jgi:hypothetical protein
MKSSLEDEGEQMITEKNCINRGENRNQCSQTVYHGALAWVCFSVSIQRLWDNLVKAGQETGLNYGTGDYRLTWISRSCT